MSDFGKVKSCNNGCGTLIYFDAQSTVGHPSPDRWVPLEYVDNTKTNMPHQCPKRSKHNNYEQKDRETDIVKAVESEPLILTVLKSIAQRLDQIATIMEEDQKDREQLK